MNKYSAGVDGQPLEGITILDLSRTLPGPLATQMLADFGAEVIKVEDTKAGDEFRSVPPFIRGVGARHLALNRNKRALAVDLKAAQGKEIFLKLARKADVMLEGFRPGVVKRLGIDYDAIKAINPRIVYCSLSGYGQTGPYRNMIGHDPNYLALSGVLSQIGRRGASPALTGPQLADVAGAHMATIGILIALRKAENTGVGDYIDVSLFDSALSLAQTATASYYGTGESPLRGTERHNGRYPWSDIYETADGGFIAIAAIEGHFYRNLCKAVGREDWLDLQYADEPEQEEIRAELTRIFLSRTRDEWFELLKDKDICFSPIITIGEALESEHVKARGNVIKHQHPVAGDTHILATPIWMANSPTSVRRGAPALGEDSAEILRSLEYSNSDIRALAAAGVIRAPDSADEPPQEKLSKAGVL